MDIKYLELLSKKYPNIMAASSEIINLGAINCLPKGTEFFFSDLHGEYEAFSYLLRSASGVIKTKIELLFGQYISKDERKELENLIYYPEVFMRKLSLEDEELAEWQRIRIYRLVQVSKLVSSKYTRSKVRKKMPLEFSYILDELLHADQDVNKERYYREIINSIVDNLIGNQFIVAICELIRNLSIDKLHIIGDIFDRGPRADIILNELMEFHDVDIQWGNHDISWMGAATGNQALIANVIRIALHYNNFDLIEDGYGINLRPLAIFAARTYASDECRNFIPIILDKNKFSPVDIQLAAKMHKAITVIQFKLEGQLIIKHPEYEMESRNHLMHIVSSNGTIDIDGREYELSDRSFPTVDWEQPLLLTDGERQLMEALTHSFNHCNKLHRHIQFLYQKGAMYHCCNNNLLYHGCIPMKEDGALEALSFDGRALKGKALLDYLNEKVNEAYFAEKDTKEQKNASDFMWYLWCGKRSPVFGKSKLSCFENHFISDKSASIELLNPYYEFSQREDICNMIMEEFGLDPTSSHIINGHVPVKIKDGEKPVKANGKLFIIDGGISKSSQVKTGIAGYTLIHNSQTLNLAEHTTFCYDEDFTAERKTPKVITVEVHEARILVGDTDNGKVIMEKIEDLKELVKAYRSGIMKENGNTF